MTENKQQYISLDSVHKTLGKWLYLEDYNLIDIVLATALSNQIEGSPVWLILVGNSGDGKTEILNGLRDLGNTINIDQLTTNSLASGKHNSNDFSFVITYYRM